MKEKLLKYIEGEEFPNYFTISQVFGLHYDEIFRLLGIKKYKAVQTGFIIRGNGLMYKKYPNITQIEVYDGFDNLINHSFKEGVVIVYEYDVLGREIRVSNNDGYWKGTNYGKFGMTFNYDSNGYWEEYIYNEKGDVIKTKSVNDCLLG